MPMGYPMNRNTLVVGIVLYPGFEVLDAFGPAEAFGSTRFPGQTVDDPGPRPFKVVYLAETRDPVHSGNGGGARVLPDAAINTSPVVEVTVKGMEYNWGRDPHKPLPEDLT